MDRPSRSDRRWTCATRITIGGHGGIGRTTYQLNERPQGSRSAAAVGPESRLHAELNDRRLNKVNLRREFFRATPAEVRDVLRKIAGQHLLEYRDTAGALEWRQSAAVTEPA